MRPLPFPQHPRRRSPEPLHHPIEGHPLPPLLDHGLVSENVHSESRIRQEYAAPVSQSELRRHLEELYEELELEYSDGHDAEFNESQNLLKPYRRRLKNKSALISEYRHKFEETQEQLRQKSNECEEPRAAYDTLLQLVCSRAQEEDFAEENIAVQLGERSADFTASHHGRFTSRTSTSAPVRTAPTPRQRGSVSIPGSIPSSSPTQRQSRAETIGKVLQVSAKSRDVMDTVTSDFNLLQITHSTGSSSSSGPAINAIEIVPELVKAYRMRIQEGRSALCTPMETFLLPDPILPDAPSPEFNRSHPVGPVYVDASSVGIGFYFENQWQAWKLDSWWKERGLRDVQWAEAVAVELGLRLMVKVGHTGQEIIMYSDNLQVVEAIRIGRSVGQPDANDVINTIKDLCEIHDIVLRIEWIPGEENPADNPSRLMVRGIGNRFPFDLTIPLHLKEFVTSYLTPWDWGIDLDYTEN